MMTVSDISLPTLAMRYVYSVTDIVYRKKTTHHPQKPALSSVIVLIISQTVFSVFS